MSGVGGVRSILIESYRPRGTNHVRRGLILPASPSAHVNWRTTAADVEEVVQLLDSLGSQVAGRT
jgi:hypothetical protein